MKSQIMEELADCKNDLAEIDKIISAAEPFSKTKHFLTMYALIKACGTIENSYKLLIASFFDALESSQARNFIETHVLKSNAAPTYDNICGLIGKFDKKWSDDFKAELGKKPDKDKIITSVKSLVDSRHEFAHGKSPSITFNSIKEYYNDARIMLVILEKILK